MSAGDVPPARGATAAPVPGEKPAGAAAHAPAVLAAGERLPQSLLRQQGESPEVQRILFAARQRFGHALCTCAPLPLKLQIRQRGGRCHLAVWPGERRAHDRDCLFFRELPAAASAPAAACVPGSPSHLDRRAPRELRTPPPHPPARVPLWIGAGTAPGAAPVNLVGLAQQLWEAADLCRWHPAWTRDWARTRYQLLHGAAGFTLNGCPLEHLLFVPRRYRSEAAVSLNREWSAFLQSLRASRVLPPRLLVAPLRAWRAPHEGQDAAVWLRHLRCTLALRPACWDFLTRTCGAALAGSRPGPRPGKATAAVDAAMHRPPERVGFFLVEPAAPGGLCARAAWLLPVHPGTWVPAADAQAVARIDALLAQGRAFHCGFAAAPKRPGPAAASSRVAAGAGVAT